MNKAELELIRGRGPNGEINPPPMEKQTNVPWGTLLRSGNMWAIMLRLFHLRLLPVDFPELAAVLSDRGPPFHADQGRHLCLAAAVGRRRRRHRRRTGDRLAVEGHRQRQDRPPRRGDCRPARLRGLHRAGRADRRRLYRRLRPDRVDVLSRIHHRAVLGGADGYRRQIFRHGIRHDEHGRQFRRRASRRSCSAIWPQGGNWQAPFIVAAGLLVIGSAVWAFWLDPDKQILAA